MMGHLLCLLLVGKTFAAIADFLNNPDLEFAFLQMDVFTRLFRKERAYSLS